MKSIARGYLIIETNRLVTFEKGRPPIKASSNYYIGYGATGCTRSSLEEDNSKISKENFLQKEE